MKKRFMMVLAVLVMVMGFVPTVTAYAQTTTSTQETTSWVEKRLSKPKFKKYTQGDTTLKWKKNANADYYELYFFRAKDDKFIKKFKVTGTTFKLSKLKKVLSKADKKETFYVNLYAFSNDRNVTHSVAAKKGSITVKFKKKATTASTATTTTEVANTNNNLTDTPDYSKYSLQQKEDGFLYYTDGENFATGWVVIDGWQYYFDNEGKMQFFVYVK